MKGYCDECGNPYISEDDLKEAEKQAKQEKAREIENRFEEWEINTGSYIMLKEDRKKLKDRLFKKEVEKLVVKQAKQEGYELGKREAFKEVFEEGIWLPYKEWKKKVPNLAKWLEDNGFRYFEKYDLKKQSKRKEMRKREEIIESIFSNSKNRDIMEKDLIDMIKLICSNIKKGIKEL